MPDFQALLLLAVFVGVIVAITKPMGLWLFAIYEGRTPLAKAEAALFRLCGIDPAREQGWRGYALGLIALHVVSVLLTYALLRLQGVLPFNPAKAEPLFAFAEAKA